MACFCDCGVKVIFRLPGQPPVAEVEAYDERKVMQRLIHKGEKVISAHLRHLATQGQQDYLQQAIDVLEENHLPIPVPANKSTPQNSFLFHATPSSARERSETVNVTERATVVIRWASIPVR